MKSFVYFGSLIIITSSFVLSTPAKAGIINAPSTLTAKHSGKCVKINRLGAGFETIAVQTTCGGTANEQWTLRPRSDAYQIISKSSGKCLNVSGALLTDGAQVIEWPCNGDNNNLWYAQQIGDYFQLKAKHSGRCLTVNGATKNNDEIIVQSYCDNGDYKMWSIPGLAHTSIQTEHSNQCLDITLESVSDGVIIVQNQCHGRDSQQWTLMPYQDAYRIISTLSNKCLALSSPSKNGSGIIQSTCAGVKAELWYPVITGKNYQLISKRSNRCLTVNNASLQSGEKLIQYLCSDAKNQHWKINTGSTTGGIWSDPINMPIVPVAAANLPNGKILLWSSRDRLDFESGVLGQTYTALFDPISNVVSERLVHDTAHDMFCPGTSNLSDGRILVNGGSSSEATSIYDPSLDVWTRVQDMNIPRGYQGNSVLSNGDVFTLGGSWSGGEGRKDGEFWNPLTGWRRTSGILSDAIVTNDPRGIFRADNHAWLFSMGNGEVFHAGPSKQMNRLSTANNGTTIPVGNRGNDDHSMNGNAVLYDVGKILKIGGAPSYDTANASKAGYVIEINNGTTTKQVASMAYARAFNSSVVLPDGTVLVFGGQSYPAPFTDRQAVLTPELWDPISGAFSTLQAMKIPRTYHSIALLMTDGRVLVGGGGLCGTCTTNHANAEIFTPPYLLNADGTNALRPTITSAPASTSYGARISLVTDGPVYKFAMLRLSSITHTVNNDQRRIPLHFTSSSGINSYSVEMPADSGIATPGYYMLFALNINGVPSVAKIIRIVDQIQQ